MASTMKEYEAKIEWLRSYMGGKCSKCGSTESLEFDHIDKSSKSFTIGSGWSFSWERLEPELKKCQLLCRDCHLKKSYECGDLVQPGTHGKARSYQNGCRCNECKSAMSTSMKRWRYSTGRQAPKRQPSCGEYGMYRKGCRCTPCKMSNAEKGRGDRARKKAEGRRFKSCCTE